MELATHISFAVFILSAIALPIVCVIIQRRTRREIQRLSTEYKALIEMHRKSLDDTDKDTPWVNTDA
jgi:hypothetical protein